MMDRKAASATRQADMNSEQATLAQYWRAVAKGHVRKQYNNMDDVALLAKRKPFAVLLTSSGAFFLIWLTTLLSILLVSFVKRFVAIVFLLYAVSREVVVAFTMALVSGALVAFILLLAVGLSVLVFPPTAVQRRVGVSILASGMSLVAAMALADVDQRRGTTVLMVGSLCASFFSSWVIFVMWLVSGEGYKHGLNTSTLSGVLHNDCSTLKMLVRLPRQICQKQLDKSLLDAVRAGFNECAHVLLSVGANVNVRDSFENSLLLLACENGNCCMTKHLLRFGADVDLHNHCRSTALQYAAKWGYCDCVKLLLDHRADPNAQDRFGRSALVIAAEHQQLPVMLLLITAGCDVGTADLQRRTALHHAALHDTDVRSLLEAGADPDAVDYLNETPLHRSAKHGTIVVSQALLEAGCNPNARNYMQRTPLHLATMDTRCDATHVDLLLRFGSNPSDHDRLGNLPIWYAAQHDNFDVVRSFLKWNFPLRMYRQKSASNPLAAALEDNRHFLRTARLLVIGGCEHAPLRKWISTSTAMVWPDQQTAHADWLRKVTQNPISLQHLCRVEIRQQLGPERAQLTTQLPLPRTLIEFVNLNYFEFIDGIELC